MANNTEVEVIKFEADVSNLKKGLKDAESSFATTEAKGVKSAKNTEKAFNGLGSSVKSALSNLPFGNLVNDLENASQSAKGLGQGISSIGSSAQGAGGGVKALTSLIGVGLIGAVALVIVAVSSLIQFFKQTDEGAAQLEATFNGLGAATDVLTGKLAELGGDLLESFEEGGVGAKILDASLLSLRATLALVTLGGSEVVGSMIGNSGIAQAMQEAAKRAYELTIELDGIQDEMRLLGVESKATELQIQALLKQAKNRGIDVTTRLGLISQAQQLENDNLQKNFELQKRYYANIADTNILKLESINQDNKAQVANVKAFATAIKTAQSAEELLYLYREQIKAQEGLRSISDDLAQTQVDGLQKIIELAGRSEILSEKYAAITSQLIEKEIADRTEGIKAVERAREAQAINTIKNEQELARQVLAIRINSLQAQKAVLQQYGKDTSAIDLEIANLNKKYLDDLTKAQADANAKRLASDKARSDAERKLAEDNFNKSKEDIDENLKFQTLAIRENAKTEDDAKRMELQATIGSLEAKKILYQDAGKSTLDIELELQAKKKQLYDDDVKNVSEAEAKKKQAIINTTQAIASNATQIYSDFAAIRTAQIQNEVTASQQASQAQQQALQEQLNQGAISQEKYNATVKQIQARQAQYERQEKNKQAKADKEGAEFAIIINTAASIAKTLATLGIPAGIPASIIAATLGAAQLGLVAARPLPKYKDGVIDVKGKGNGTSDSIDAKISRGESVMTADETKEHKGLLWAIRKNKLDEYADRAWVKPAIKMLEHEKAIKHRNGKSAKKAKQESFDTSHMEHLIKKNKSVRIENWHEMPKSMKGRKIV